MNQLSERKKDRQTDRQKERKKRKKATKNEKLYWSFGKTRFLQYPGAHSHEGQDHSGDPQLSLQSHHRATGQTDHIRDAKGDRDEIQRPGKMVDIGWRCFLPPHDLDQNR